MKKVVIAECEPFTFRSKVLLLVVGLRFKQNRYKFGDGRTIKVKVSIHFLYEMCSQKLFAARISIVYISKIDKPFVSVVILIMSKG